MYVSVKAASASAASTAAELCARPSLRCFPNLETPAEARLSILWRRRHLPVSPSMEYISMAEFAAAAEVEEEAVAAYIYYVANYILYICMYT
jgi:hypothetical protein